MTSVGYCRVSTADQRLDPQLDALRAAGCATIVQETASGAQRDRPELARALAMVQRGDTLVVVKIDRVARSALHLLQVVRGLEKRGAYFRSLGDPIDTASPQGRLMFGILASFAEFERDIIRDRTRAGLAAARARGRVGGNPLLQTPEGRARMAATRHARAKAPKPAAQPPAPVLATVAALCARGVPPLRTLGRELHRVGARPPGNGAWHPSSVAAVVALAREAGLLPARSASSLIP